MSSDDAGAARGTAALFSGVHIDLLDHRICPAKSAR
jgi:hypothetical protein